MRAIRDLLRFLLHWPSKPVQAEPPPDRVVGFCEERLDAPEFDGESLTYATLMSEAISAATAANEHILAATLSDELLTAAAFTNESITSPALTGEELITGDCC